MRFRIELPDSNQKLAYGWDHALGWFGDVLSDRDRVVSSYNLLEPNYDHARPLWGLLTWLSQQGRAWCAEDLEEALVLLLDRSARELPRRLQILGSVICDLRAAARG
jgi:hypothetical protein